MGHVWEVQTTLESRFASLACPACKGAPIGLQSEPIPELTTPDWSYGELKLAVSIFNNLAQVAGQKADQKELCQQATDAVRLMRKQLDKTRK